MGVTSRRNKDNCLMCSAPAAAGGGAAGAVAKVGSAARGSNRDEEYSEGILNSRRLTNRRLSNRLSLSWRLLILRLLIFLSRRLSSPSSLSLSLNSLKFNFSFEGIIDHQQRVHIIR